MDKFQDQNSISKQNSQLEDNVLGLNFSYEQPKYEYDGGFVQEQNFDDGSQYQVLKKVKKNSMSEYMENKSEFDFYNNNNQNNNNNENTNNQNNNYIEQQQQQQQQQLKEELNMINQEQQVQKKMHQKQLQNKNKQQPYNMDEKMLLNNSELFKTNSNKGTYVNKIHQIMGAENMVKIYMEEGEKEQDEDFDIKVSQDYLDQLGLKQQLSNSNNNTQQQQQQQKEKKGKKEKKTGTTNNKKRKIEELSREANQLSNSNNFNSNQELNSGNGISMCQNDSSNNIAGMEKPDKVELNQEEKLEKNRESARNSRIRKKIYIELLESKVLKLTEELELTKSQLSEKDSYLEKIQYQTRLLDKYYSGQEAFFDKLDALLQQPQKDQASINMLLDSMRLRMGVSGKERKDAMNYFFKQYLNIAMPQHLRYLIWTAVENKDVFEQEEDKNKPEWRQNLMRLMEPTRQQVQRLQRFKQLLNTERDNIDTILENILHSKQQLLEKMYTIEFAVDEIREYFSPIQSAQVMNCLHRNPHNSDYSHQKLWKSLNRSTDFQFYDDEDYDTQQQNMQKIFKIGKQQL